MCTDELVMFERKEEWGGDVFLLFFFGRGGGLPISTLFLMSWHISAFHSFRKVISSLVFVVVIDLYLFFCCLGRMKTYLRSAGTDKR